MNLEQARAAAYTAFEAAVGTISPVPPIQWPNREGIDRSQQTAPYVALDFVIGRSVQKSLGTSNRTVRYVGMLAILVCVKEGAGLATPTQMLDKLILGLSLKNFSGLQFESAYPQRPTLEDGWHIQPLAVPFYFDDLL